MRAGDGQEAPLFGDARRPVQLRLQNESPGKDKGANWLPAPKGDFILMLRMNWPRDKDTRRCSTAAGCRRACRRSAAEGFRHWGAKCDGDAGHGDRSRRRSECRTPTLTTGVEVNFNRRTQ
ncbi:MAG: DUF1214 domain-containing protein [Rubrivivax sp.]|nr:DUF1214 domain-containing protein [Rubrivivax sp.]